MLFSGLEQGVEFHPGLAIVVVLGLDLPHRLTLRGHHHVLDGLALRVLDRLELDDLRFCFIQLPRGAGAVHAGVHHAACEIQRRHARQGGHDVEPRVAHHEGQRQETDQ